MTAWLVFGVVLMLACLLVAPSGRAQEVLRAKGLYQGKGELDEPTMNKTGE